MKVPVRRVFQCLGKIFIPCVLSTQVHAGGLNIYEMGNPADVSTGGAGLAAKARDATTVFANPAGMTRIKTPELAAGATALYLSGHFDPDESITTIAGSDGNASMFFGAGNVAYVHPVNNDLVFGISAQNLMGLTLGWENSWVGRYQEQEEWAITPRDDLDTVNRVKRSFPHGTGKRLPGLETGKH